MSINILFQKANKFFIKNNYIEGLNVLKDIWIRYPNNSRLIDEVSRNEYLNISVYMALNK